jgi:hypothetical protein
MLWYSGLYRSVDLKVVTSGSVCLMSLPSQQQMKTVCAIQTSVLMYEITQFYIANTI